jgi:predicted enzyme related to lactoylglutathione lyase
MFKALMTAAYPIAPERLAEAKAWYRCVMHVDPYFDQPFYIGFNIAGYELGLFPKSASEAAQQTTGTQAYWGVDDIKAHFDEMVAASAEVIEAPHDVGGEIEVALLRDPFGNHLGLIHNPHFGR